MKNLLKKRNTLFYRIWVSTVLISILSLLIVNLMWYNNTSSIVYRKEIQSASNLLYQLNMRMENMFNAVGINTYSFLFDSKTRDVLSRPAKNEEEKKENEAYILEIFRNIKKNNTAINSLEFVGQYYEISSEMDSSNVDFERLKAYDWYRMFSDYYVEMKTPVYYNDYIEKYNSQVIGWVRKLNTSTSSYSIGNFLIEISYPSISYVVEEAVEKSGNPILLFDKRGNVLYSPEDLDFSSNELELLMEQSKISEEPFSFEGQNHKFSCLVEKLASSGWYMVMLIDKQILSAYIKESVLQSLLIGIFIVFMGFAVASVLSRNIIKPINELASTMKLVEKGNLDVSVPDDTSIIEVSVLSKGFNKMLAHINQLIDDIKQEAEENKTMEIRMLQAQINPHFLYNTLNAIRWKAVMHGETAISDMIIALVKLLEFSGKKTGDLVTIEKELEHAVGYLELIQYQYPDGFEVRYDIDPEALKYYTVKFILQPLLENAVFHGVEPLEEKGRIDLHIKYQETRIFFSIEDNGVGMPSEVIKNISAFRGWGIFNVNERLRKLYGETAMLHIESKEGWGTKITFHIPVMTEADIKGAE